MSSSVLICDDSNLARKQVLRSLPECWEANVKLAHNGLEALELLRQESFKIMFLDLTMPELDGIGVLEAIQAESIDITVFVISADIQPEMQSRVMSLGAKSFIQKPVKAETLSQVLKQSGYL